VLIASIFTTQKTKDTAIYSDTIKSFRNKEKYKQSKKNQKYINNQHVNINQVASTKNINTSIQPSLLETTIDYSSLPTPSKEIFDISLNGNQSSVKDSFLNAMRNAYTREEIEQLRIFLHYLQIMKYDVNGCDKIEEGLIKLSTDYHATNDDDYKDKRNCNKHKISNGMSRDISSEINQYFVTSLDKLNIFGNSNAHETGENDHFKSTIPSVTQTSHLQTRVLKGLNQAVSALAKTKLNSNFESLKHNLNQLDIQSEISSFNGVFPVDIGIFFNQELISIIEVDGPQHYRHDGKLRRKDKLKESMYSRKHPDSKIHRLRWDDVSKIGFDVIGLEIIEQTVLSTKERNVVSKTMKYMERSISEFFNWGLRNSKLY
jgi:hypothetical protein